MSNQKHADAAPVNILTIDDNPGDLRLLEAELRDRRQNIVCKCSGEEALKYLYANDVAVILIDVRMPSMDGLETAALIRQREDSSHTPIIFLTGASPPEEEVVKAGSSAEFMGALGVSRRLFDNPMCRTPWG